MNHVDFNTFPSYREELATAMEAAQEAGSLLKAQQSKTTIAETKDGHHNYATEQDLSSERIIVDAIRRRFASDEILAEESARPVDSHDRVWIVDPLDGTRNYANGLPYFAISIGLCVDGQVKVGVVYAPCYNDTVYYAVQGHGVYSNDRPLQMIRPHQHLADSILATGFSYFRGKELVDALDTYAKVLDHCTDILRFGAAALDLCHVAAGLLGAYYESGLKPWDVAAGSLILTEAGGCVSDYSGGPLAMFQQGQANSHISILAAKGTAIRDNIIGLIGPS